MNDAGIVGAPTASANTSDTGKPTDNGTIGPATTTPKVNATGAKDQGPIGNPVPCAPSVGKSSGAGSIGAPTPNAPSGGNGGTMEAVAGQKAGTPGRWVPRGAQLRAANSAGQNAASKVAPVRGSVPVMDTMPGM